MFRTLIPATALLATLAFAARTETQTTPDATPMAWTLTHEGDMAKLAYGVPRSDHLAVMLTCAPGGHVEVYGSVRPDSPALQQASATAAPIDPLSGELLEDIRLPATDRTLARMASGPGLAVLNEQDEMRVIPVNATERRLARSFLAHCASTRT
jgi:hypothetical protein